ncbi:sec-independent translocase [Solicola gregarius]|uniref:Sec-independent translocase n=1 Tax=Solicola gregarius TaxID=2908642 RepID=A0AA46TIY5_9ACTN|nr:sec-independent translocase [Solicola gregarius]UYM06166.1 sec-independent translocase [Solicola gregarius]
MFDIGPAEIVVIVVIAIVVFGPDKLPQFARQAGRFLKTARRMMDDAKSDLAAEMGDDFDGLKDLNLRELDPREIVRRNVVEAMESGDDKTNADKDESDGPRRRRGHRPLGIGERPPYDPEST